MSEGFRLPDQRVDERDTLFARMARRPGTRAYEDYYARRPELRGRDDWLRARPELCEPGGKQYDAAIAWQARDWFDSIRSIRPDAGLVSELVTRARTQPDLTEGIEAICLELGAVAVGCAPLDEAFVYSHKGRHDADYGTGVKLDHTSAIVFLVEMDYAAMQRAPHSAVLLESARQYYRAAEISLTLAFVLDRLGFAARAHFDAHFDVILPPLAVRAGLGELGRNNILVAHRFGSRVRIGAVSTDAAVRYRAPADLGVGRFCEKCRRCAEACPARALRTGPATSVRGIVRWTTDVERCHGYWRAIGSDCGICMASCPFSRRDSPFHSMMRWLVRTAPIVHPLLLRGHDLLYGKAWQRPKRKKRSACAEAAARSGIRPSVKPGAGS